MTKDRLSRIAIMTKDLEGRRTAILKRPIRDRVTADGTPMDMTIITHMVKGQKDGFRFAAAYTFTAIALERF